jgi:hypothetical protein
VSDWESTAEQVDKGISWLIAQRKQLRAENRELREALDVLFVATLNDMTVRGVPREWDEDSALAQAYKVLQKARS